MSESPWARDHIVGIGGVGMSALAQALRDAGVEVSGSDRQLRQAGVRSVVLEQLARQGVRVSPDDGSLIDSSVRRVIVSTAIEQDNPEIVRAYECGIPIVHRAVALSEFLSVRKLVAVAGTCGKSTVTAVLGHLLASAGLDPLVVNGARVVGWDNGGTHVGSVRWGRGEWAVAEVDESDKSLKAFHPQAAIVTNASADHYGLDEMNEVFDAFRASVDGPVIDGRHDPIVPSALARTIPLPGEHNAINAECALRLARALGVGEDALAQGLATFPGVERRLQRIGVQGASGCVVYDDYAHNPEKLRAMWTTLAAAYPKGIAVVWRPHGYGPLVKMLDALVEMFLDVLRTQDALVLLPVYDAGGTANRSVNSDALASRLANARGSVCCLRDCTDVYECLSSRLANFGAVVTAGARDPELPVLARRFLA